MCCGYCRYWQGVWQLENSHDYGNLYNNSGMDFGLFCTSGRNFNFNLMIQDLVVNILIVAALTNVTYQCVKLIKRKNVKSACGCSDCEIKKNIIQKKVSS